MRLYFLLLSVVVLHAGRDAFAQTDSAQLRGAIVDESSTPVIGARVTLIQPGRIAHGSRGQSRNAVMPAALQTLSDSAGNFRLARLPAASYDICVEAPGYLTTCEWQHWVRVTVASGAVVDRGPLKLIRAAPVSIHLEDPSGLLRSASQIAFPLFAVLDQFGRVHSARKVSTQENRYTFQVEAPYETKLALRVHSAQFLLRDAQGRAIGLLGADTPFQAERGVTAPLFTFSVAGEISQPEWPPVSVRPPGTALP